MRKLVYVMAPFRANTEMGRQSNIWRAKLVGVELAKAGFAPVVPHVAVAFYHDTLPESQMMEICLSLLQASNHALLIAHSEGVDQECQFAKEQGISIYTDIHAIPKI